MQKVDQVSYMFKEMRDDLVCRITSCTKLFLAAVSCCKSWESIVDAAKKINSANEDHPWYDLIQLFQSWYVENIEEAVNTFVLGYSSSSAAISTSSRPAALIQLLPVWILIKARSHFLDLSDSLDERPMHEDDDELQGRNKSDPWIFLYLWKTQCAPVLLTPIIVELQLTLHAIRMSLSSCASIVAGVSTHLNSCLVHHAESMPQPHDAQTLASHVLLGSSACAAAPSELTSGGASLIFFEQLMHVLDQEAHAPSSVTRRASSLLVTGNLCFEALCSLYQCHSRDIVLVPLLDYEHQAVATEFSKLFAQKRESWYSYRCEAVQEQDTGSADTVADADEGSIPQQQFAAAPSSSRRSRTRRSSQGKVRLSQPPPPPPQPPAAAHHDPKPAGQDYFINIIPGRQRNT